MNNFPVQHEGKTYWISRNMAVACFVFTAIGGDWFVLANKRGENTPDFQGMWNAPCGYLDFDETTAQAAMREVYEETGVKLNKVNFWMFNDAVDENRQNVTFRYYAIIPNPQFANITKQTRERGGEEGEVSKISWIPLSEISKHQWAFNHDKLIIELAQTLNLI